MRVSAPLGAGLRGLTANPQTYPNKPLMAD